MTTTTIDARTRQKPEATRRIQESQEAEGIDVDASLYRNGPKHLCERIMKKRRAESSKPERHTHQTNH
jgi:hypothetical protein